MLSGAGAAHAPLQDRHAAARECAHGRLLAHGAAAGRRGDRAVLVFHHAPGREQGRVLPDLYQRAHACHHPREPRPQPDLLRRDRGRRPALLPVDRDEDHDLPRQAAPPAVHRTDGARHGGALHSRLLLLPAGGCADRDAAHAAGARARGDDPLCLRDRV